MLRHHVAADRSHMREPRTLHRPSKSQVGVAAGHVQLPEEQSGGVPAQSPCSVVKADGVQWLAGSGWPGMGSLAWNQSGMPALPGRVQSTGTSTVVALPRGFPPTRHFPSMHVVPDLHAHGVVAALVVHVLELVQSAWGEVAASLSLVPCSWAGCCYSTVAAKLLSKGQCVAPPSHSPIPQPTYPQAQQVYTLQRPPRHVGLSSGHAQLEVQKLPHNSCSGCTVRMRACRVWLAQALHATCKCDTSPCRVAGQCNLAAASLGCAPYTQRLPLARRTCSWGQGCRQGIQ